MADGKTIHVIGAVIVVLIIAIVAGLFLWHFQVPSLSAPGSGSGNPSGSGGSLTGLASSPTYVYGTGGGTTSASATVSSGNVIFCAGAVGIGANQGVNAGLTPSWTSDVNDIYHSTSVGHQTSLTCSASSNTNANIIIGGIGVTTNLPYTVTSSSGQESNDSYPISYTLSHPSYVVILVACGEEGANGTPCYFNNLPSGCSQVFQAYEYNDYSESALGAICNMQFDGAYSFSVSDLTRIAMVSYGVYAFNLQTSPVCALVNTTYSEMFLSGLKSTTLTTTQSCGATNFQWYEEAPGASSFSEISGATSNTYLFSLPSGATTGTYQFDVQTSNNQGNQATSTPINVIVTNDPYAYVANSNYVSIVDVTTGNVLDAITSGFYYSHGMAFYSGNAYVVNYNFGSDNVVEINPSNGDAISSWTSGFSSPEGIAFYSGNAYVANAGSGNVVEINPSNGDVIGSWNSGFYGSGGIAFYSGNAYVVNQVSSNVVEINPSTGDAIGSWTSGISNPFDIAFYSGNAYVANAGSGNVVEINPSNGDVIGSWNSGFDYPAGIAFYSGNAYVSNFNSGNVIEINPSTGGVIGSWTSGFSSPVAIAFPT